VDPGSRIRLLGVNAAGEEAGNALAAEVATIPLLQDTPEVGAWAAWAVTYRDVVVLDGDGAAVGRFNLTDNSLADPENRAALRDWLRALAGE
jgi:hypothetical protein